MTHTRTWEVSSGYQWNRKLQVLQGVWKSYKQLHKTKGQPLSLQTLVWLYGIFHSYVFTAGKDRTGLLISIYNVKSVKCIFTILKWGLLYWISFDSKDQCPPKEEHFQTMALGQAWHHSPWRKKRIFLHEPSFLLLDCFWSESISTPGKCVPFTH